VCRPTWTWIGTGCFRLTSSGPEQEGDPGPTWTESAMPSRARFELAGEVTAPALFRQLEIRVQKTGECLGLCPAERCITPRPGGQNWPRRARAPPCVRSQILQAPSPPRPSRGPRPAGDPRDDSRRPLSPIRVFGILANHEYAESGLALTLATDPFPSAGETHLSTRLPARRAS